ncbi:MAG TPA: DinB family protein [Polyangiaceae bacterium]|jgi:uncharacterized damage-inducible protein DinB
MDALSLLVRMARNNAWANHRLYAACAVLPPGDLHAKRTSFFPSIAATLNHNLIVDWYYVDALLREGRGRSVFSSEMPFTEIGPLREAQWKVDLRLVGLVEAMRSEAELDVEVRLERDDHVQVERAGDVLAHLFQHQVHHRGQAHAMLAGTHVPPPQLDEFFLREELPLRRGELEELGLPLE